MYREGLSIIIPSFNRAKELKRLLRSIYTEDLSEVYEIVIIDNNSDYNVFDVLSDYDNHKLRIIRNPVNVRMGNNIMNCYSSCRSKWMWIISDDDQMIKGGVQEVLKRIKEYSDYSYLKFSTEGIRNGVELNSEVSSLEGLVDYYKTVGYSNSGNLVFISNGIYNLELLNPFIGKGFEHSYTYIPHLIPVFFALANNCKVHFFSTKIINRIFSDKDIWSISTVGLGLSTLSHLNLKLDRSYEKEFYRLVMVVDSSLLFHFLVKNKIERSHRIFRLIYQSIYTLYLNPFEKMRAAIMFFILRVSIFRNWMYNWFYKRS